MKWLKKLSLNTYINAVQHKVGCPVCMDYFYMNDAPYRCLNKSCKKEPETVIEEAFSLQMPPMMGKVFFRPYMHRWEKLYKRRVPEMECPCPSCYEPSYQRLCPSCHTSLPADFWKHPTYLILLIGSAKSGKSSYIASLLKRLKSVAADGYNFIFDTEHAYASPWQPPLFRYKSANTGKTKAFITFFELPSKAIETYENLHDYQTYLKRADGLFVFLDPSTFPGIGGAKKRLSEKGIEVLTAYLEQMKVRKKREDFPPTAFIVTKLDLVMNLLPLSTILRHDTEPKGLYDEREGYQVSREVRGYLGAWSGPGLLQTIIYAYFREPYRFFSTASDEGKIELQNYAPLRVEEPFLWLFREIHRGKKEDIKENPTFTKPLAFKEIKREEK